LEIDSITKITGQVQISINAYFNEHLPAQFYHLLDYKDELGKCKCP